MGFARGPAGISLVIFVAAASLTFSSSQHPEYPPARGETEQLIHDALLDRFKAGDIPDLGLIENRRHVYVLKEMRAAKLTLTADALPKLPHTTFELISFPEAETIAKRTGHEVTYLSVDDPRIEGTSATILLGVDIAMPPDTEMVKMCCCAGRGEFRRAAGDHWVFVKWSQMTCA